MGPGQLGSDFRYELILWKRLHLAIVEVDVDLTVFF